jgi:superfamily II DNA or RNA helicase
VDEGHSAVPHVILHTFEPEPGTIPSWDERTTKYTEYYQKVVQLHTGRNECIIRIVKELYDAGLVSVIFIDRREHALRLQAMLKTTHSLPSQVYTGAQSTEERRAAFAAIHPSGQRITFASRILSTGKSTKEITAIVEATGMKKPHLRLQMLGRGLREKREGESNTLILVDLQDRGSVMQKAARIRRQVWRGDKAVRLYSTDTIRELKEAIASIQAQDKTC